MNLILRAAMPDDYHCECRYCAKLYKGEILNEDGSYPNKFDRNKDYPDKGMANNGKKVEGKLPGHLAKTPLHLARFCVGEFSKKNDWVYDPTMGSGTTGVEALRAGRRAIGAELDPEHYKVARRNMKGFAEGDAERWDLVNVDARKIVNLPKLSLVINNPPYIGDKSKAPGAGVYEYRKIEGQIVLMKEGPAYYDAIMDLYEPAVRALKTGGFLCIGVKDMMRRQEYYLLHYYLTRAVEQRFPDMKCVAVHLLRHWPMTGNMRSYEKRFGIWPALYQTITTLKKD